jgi:hypothetical protein
MLLRMPWRTIPKIPKILSSESGDSVDNVLGGKMLCMNHKSDFSNASST